MLKAIYVGFFVLYVNWYNIKNTMAKVITNPKKALVDAKNEPIPSNASINTKYIVLFIGVIV